LAPIVSKQDEEEGYPNYNNTGRASSYMRVFVASLPARSELYDYDSGDLIDELPAEIFPLFTDSEGTEYSAAQVSNLDKHVSLVKSYPVRVRPAHNQFSTKVSHPCLILIRN
jgi:hypothetical protein